MGNTNFQTIHQMGTAISNMVKQATGRDAVQNIDMEHVTVAQNHRYEDVDISGRAVSFQAGEAGIPFEKMVVQIKPVQDLHGYDSPWPAGGGKNKYNSAETEWKNGVLDDDGNPVATSFSHYTANFTKVKSGTAYILSGYISSQNVIVRIYFYTSGKTWISRTSGTTDTTCTFTTPATCEYIRIQCGTLITATTDWQIEEGSTATAYEPYSNICPITGWTMVNVYQSGQNMEDARVYRFPFPSEAGIVYGGTLDVISGDMVVDRVGALLNDPDKWGASTGNIRYIYEQEFTDRMHYDNSYTGLMCSYARVKVDGNFTARWNGASTDKFGIFDRLELITLEQVKADATEGKIAISYPLAHTLTFHLSQQEITTLLGQNHIWADTGDIEVKFTNVKELY